MRAETNDRPPRAGISRAQPAEIGGAGSARATSPKPPPPANHTSQMQSAAAERLEEGGQLVAPATEVAATSSPRTEQRQSGCHLSARTADNQCALHGADGRQATTPPTTALATTAAGAATTISGEPEESVQREARELARPQAAAAAADEAQTTRARSGRTRERRQAGRARDKAVALWPLAKPALDDGRSFGDCEDILSPHLTAGRVGRRQRQSLREALREVSSMSQQTNCRHRRPFGQPFERPSSGWIYNATGHEKFDPRSAGSLKGE